MVNAAVEQTATLDQVDWMFLSVLASPNCKNETFHSLQYQYSLPDFIKLKQYIEIMDAYDAAKDKDLEMQMKTENKR